LRSARKTITIGLKRCWSSILSSTEAQPQNDNNGLLVDPGSEPESQTMSAVQVIAYIGQDLQADDHHSSIKSLKHGLRSVTETINLQSVDRLETLR